MTLTTFWLIVLVLMIVIELITLGNLVTLWFAIGSAAALLIAYINDSLALQITVFAIVSVISLIFVRPIAYKLLRGNVIATNADRLVGRTLRLDKAITHEEWGLVDVNGVEWSVTTADNTEIEAGSLVEVRAIEGVKLIVKKI